VPGIGGSVHGVDYDHSFPIAVKLPQLVSQILETTRTRHTWHAIRLTDHLKRHQLIDLADF
jgi:hypothetical protein